MLIYDRQMIAQAFSRSSIPTNPIALAEEVYSWPQLFLYSNSDTLIPASVSSVHFYLDNSAVMSLLDFYTYFFPVIFFFNIRENKGKT